MGARVHYFALVTFRDVSFAIEKLGSFTRGILYIYLLVSVSLCISQWDNTSFTENCALKFSLVFSYGVIISAPCRLFQVLLLLGGDPYK
jgi:hypothetical protein